MCCSNVGPYAMVRLHVNRLTGSAWPTLPTIASLAAYLTPHTSPLPLALRATRSNRRKGLTGATCHVAFAVRGRSRFRARTDIGAEDGQGARGRLRGGERPARRAGSEWVTRTAARAAAGTGRARVRAVAVSSVWASYSVVDGSASLVSWRIVHTIIMLRSGSRKRQSACRLTDSSAIGEDGMNEGRQVA
ncbi:hypothetical protein K438DRAFT_1926855 [Mycena galopus ATCC 62051]|nr:hypothetical protein K438DRAFT_1926855 [Mycena galopus ATCC 62051]